MRFVRALEALRDDLELEGVESMTLRDPELLELLADKPELLAVADAVAATQQPPRRSFVRRRATRLAAVAAVAAAVVAVALVLPQGEHGIVDRAIAAIGDGRVLHLVAEVPTGTVDVDLQSGRRTVQQYRLELWADQQLSDVHAVMTFKGQIVADMLWPQDAQKRRDRRPRRPRVHGPLERLPQGARGRHGEARRRRRSVRPPRLLAALQPRRASRPAARSPSTRRRTSRSSGATTTAPGAIDQHILLAETHRPRLGRLHAPRPRPVRRRLVSGGSSSGSMGSDDTPPSTTVPSGWLTAGA